jgi:hypothetical protein
MGRLIPWFLRRLILNPEKGELLTGSSDDLNATLAILGTVLVQTSKKVGARTRAP